MYIFPEPKDPSDIKEYVFDFKGLTNGREGAEEDYLDSGEVISSHAVTVPEGITKDSSSVKNSGSVVEVWLSGGTDNTQYAITCQVVTDSGRTYEFTGLVRVKNR